MSIVGCESYSQASCDGDESVHLFQNDWMEVLGQPKQDYARYAMMRIGSVLINVVALIAIRYKPPNVQRTEGPNLPWSDDKALKEAATAEFERITAYKHLFCLYRLESKDHNEEVAISNVILEETTNAFILRFRPSDEKAPQAPRQAVPAGATATFPAPAAVSSAPILPGTAAGAPSSSATLPSWASPRKASRRTF